MANNTKKLERELEKGLKELLLNMNEEEFKEYFKQLIEKYYAVLFTFDKDYNNYVDNSKKKYKIIKEVKSILASKYNNLDNYENSVRLGKAEDIAYKNMNELYYMEEAYTYIIYNSSIQELIFINATLTNLIELYEEEPSENLIAVIEDLFQKTGILVKNIKKLPINEEETLKEITEKLIKEEKEASEGYYVGYNQFNGAMLKQALEEFNKTFEKLETILPEDVINAYNFELEYPEKIAFFRLLLDLDVEETSKEDIASLVAYIDSNKKKNFKGYLYQVLDSWS